MIAIGVHSLSGLARMYREVKSSRAGKRNVKKVKKSDGFWCEAASCIAFYCRFIKYAIQKHTGTSSTKTTVTPYSREMDSQFRAMSSELEALTSPLSTLWQRLNKVVIQLNDQSTQFHEFITQVDIPKTELDALKDQRAVRDTQLNALIVESSNLSKQMSRLIEQLTYNMSTQNTDFSAMRNGIAAYKTAGFALQTKLIDFENNMMDMPVHVPVLIIDYR
jgi:septal ring factor EnvC (AmiA/AmiB activator)